MTDNASLLLKLINEGKTIKEISEEMNLSHKKIWTMLSLIKNKGFEFDRIFHYNGDIIYNPKKTFIETPSNSVDLITSHSDNEIEVLVISDLHIGSIIERPDLLSDLYEYCAKEGINIIIIAGDLIDGTFGKFDKIYDNVSDQIDYLLKVFPFDKSILNLVTLGDHDLSALKDCGQNIIRVLENYRHDIVPLGYGLGKINIKDDFIWVRHRGIEEIKMEPLTNCLLLDGHSHGTLSYNSHPNNYTRIQLSPFCDFSEFPTAVRMKLEFKNGKIFFGSFEQLFFGAKTLTVSKFEIPLGYGKDINPKVPIKLESDRAKKKVLTQNVISQIDKFNSKWML